MSREPATQANNKENSLKPLVVLRKSLSQVNQTGVISYYTESMNTGRIQVTSGHIATDQSSLLNLTEMLSAVVISCEFTLQQTNEKHEHRLPPLALSSVLNDIQWDKLALEKMKTFFYKFPPVNIELASMHKLGFNDGLTYLSLYQASLKEKEFTVRSFLTEQKEYSSLERQIKALVFGYCIGLINPDASVSKKKQQAQVPPKRASRRSSIASMILMKIKGL